MDFKLVERLRLRPARSFTIMPESNTASGAGLPLVTVRCDSAGQVHLEEKSAVAANTERMRVQFNGKPGNALFGGKKIQWKMLRQRGFRIQKPQHGKETFDADKVGNSIVLRHWEAGDRFQPIGMARPVKLQDLFTNQKIPRARRHDLIVATTLENELFWVEGLRIGERFKLTPQTTRQIIWRWSMGKNRRLRVSAHHVRLAQLKNVRRK